MTQITISASCFTVFITASKRRFFEVRRSSLNAHRQARTIVIETWAIEIAQTITNQIQHLSCPILPDSAKFTTLYGHYP